MHGHRLADEAAETVASGLFLDGGDLRLEFAPLERVADGDAQPVRAERLGQEVERAFLHGFHGQAHRGLAGHDHDLGREAAVAHLPHQVDAVHVGEVDVQHQDVGGKRVDGGKCLLADAEGLDAAILGF